MTIESHNERVRDAQLAALYAELARWEAALVAALAGDGDLGTLEDDIIELQWAIEEIEEEDDQAEQPPEDKP